MGYALGLRSAATRGTSVTGNIIPPNTTSSDQAGQPAEYDSESEEEDAADGDLAAVKPGFMEQCKLVRLPLHLVRTILC